MNDEGYVRFLGRYFFAPGYDREDIEQTARLAMFLSPERPRLAARRDVLDLVKIGNRRAFVELRDVHAVGVDLADQIEARIRLGLVLREVRTRNEQIAVGRTLRGEPIRREEHALQTALLRFRRRMGV